MFCSFSSSADLVQSDGGLYTCQARSASGQAVCSASLSVSAGAPLLAPPSMAEFPGSPSKPEVANATSYSVTVAWEKPMRIGGSNLQGYQVRVMLMMALRAAAVEEGGEGREGRGMNFTCLSLACAASACCCHHTRNYWAAERKVGQRRSCSASGIPMSLHFMWRIFFLALAGLQRRAKATITKCIAAILPRARKYAQSYNLAVSDGRVFSIG